MAERRKQTSAEDRAILRAAGITDADIRAVVALSPPLADWQRELIAEVSQPILRRMRDRSLATPLVS